MSAPAAIRATFAQYAMVKTRGVLVLHMEIPLEQQAEVFAALGYPIPGNEVWVGIARLVAAPQNPEGHCAPIAPEGHPKHPDFVASQRGKAAYANGTSGEKARVRAGLLPKDARFQAWVCQFAGFPTDGAQFIRDRCCFGESRKLIAEDLECLERFLAMETDYLVATGQMAEPR